MPKLKCTTAACVERPAVHVFLATGVYPYCIECATKAVAIHQAMGAPTNVRPISWTTDELMAWEEDDA
jgi:hypothetical protein